jgi:4-hydroxy-tetrahydrodipicolinate reductase
MLKIALFGCGKMGQLIEKIAPDYEIEIIAKSSRNALLSDDELSAAELFLDFSHSSQVMLNLETAIRLKKPLVIGTTGWEAQLNVAKTKVENSGIGVLFAPNFSLGVSLFILLLTHAKEVFRSFPDYEIAGIEYHHRHKADAPSGTAKKISGIFEDQLTWASVRCGYIPGTHTVIFDSFGDSIALTHEARNREGFADGALKAAHWMKDKKGWRTLDEMVRTLYSARDSI